MSDQDFVHLHVHTEFSLLDGLSKIDKLVARAAELGMKSLAITDHGAMFGVINFYKACKKNEIKPIIGMEGYLARRDMHVHDQSERQPFHLLLLAQDMTGYKNLLQIASAAQLEGFYSKPRIDRDFLAAHSEGIICTSGCLAAEIPRLVVDGRDDEARRMIGTYLDIFGKDRFYIELQDHDIPEIKVLNDWLISNRDYADVKLLATNDVHYVLDGDFNAHDTLLCIQTGSLKSDVKRMRMTDPSYHLRTQQEMWDIFGHIRGGEPLRTSLEIAEMCNVSLDSKGYHLPIFPVPEGYTADTFLRFLAERGLQWRYGDGITEAHRTRLNYELGIIHQMGFDTYFLIVWDLCQYARKADIWWNVRGSGAGSVTAYCLGITSIDPIENNLIFERFLNPGRVSMPDIDMDFPDDRRMDMIDYAMRKYGSEKVAAIITFGTMKARAAIKDVGRVLNYPLPEVNALTKLVPQIPSKPVTLADCLGDNPEKAVPELKKLYSEKEEIKILLDTALTVEGVARNAGTHAAGIIIGDKPLVDYLPLHRPIGDTKVSQVTQFPMETCESIGLLKVDFLGLSTLTIMRKACELVEKYHGIRYTMANIPYLPRENDDEYNKKLEKAFDIIGKGETTGIFQLEGAGMTRMLVEMKPRTFQHIIAAISLYRPGPMELIPTYIKRMHGKEEISYHHSLLEPILHETYGIVVYQEQIQQIAAQLFGYSLGDADLMRRAVSKKKIKDLATHKQIFMEKGPERGVSAEIAEKIFDEIEYFAAYGFNKCVTYNTEVIDPNTGRLHKIGDLATGKAILTNTLTCNTETLKLTSGVVVSVWDNGVKPVFRVTTRLGREIEATANHPFYAFDGWRMLADLKIGDKIAVPRRIPVEGKKSWADHEVIALGQLLSEDTAAIPNEVFELNNDRLALLIDTLWSNNQKPYLASSKRTVHQLQHLLLRLGILSQISQCREGYQLEVINHDYSFETGADIAYTTANNRSVTYSIGANSVDVKTLGITTKDIDNNIDDIYWDQIASIEYIGEQPTYDLTIPGTHNFVANDIIVHNSHAADYAVLTCQTAYLKAHYPEEYYTALLTVQRDVIEDVQSFINDCRHLGIPILPPGINGSDLNFTIERTGKGKQRGIRYGLGAVKNAGEKAVQVVIDERNANGKFKDLSDFCRRVDLRAVGKRALESLAKVGAFDDLGRRDAVLQSVERMMKYSADHHRAADAGQMSLFGGGAVADTSDDFALVNIPAGKETAQRDMLRWEKELIGLYVSEHPLNMVMKEIRQLSNIHYSEDLRRDSESVNGKNVTVAGLVIEIKTLVTKKGDTMAIVSIEDVQGTLDCTLFPRSWTQFQPMIKEDRVVIAKGKVDTTRGDVQIIVDSISQDFEVVSAAGEPDDYNDNSWWPETGSGSTTTEWPEDEAVNTTNGYNASNGNANTHGNGHDNGEYAGNSNGHPEDGAEPYLEQATVYGSSYEDTDPDAVVNPVYQAEQIVAAKMAPRLQAKKTKSRVDSEPCMITITVERTDDADKDKRRILRLVDKLLEYPGPDKFRFRIIGLDKTVIVDFPEHSTDFSEVEDILFNLVGAQSVYCEALANYESL